MSRTKATKKPPAKRKGAPKKAPAKRGRGRPPTDPAKLAAAVAAVRGGADYDAAAAEHGVGERVLRDAVKAAEAAAPTKVEPLTLDPEASALDNARALLDHAVRSIGKLPAGSSRLNPAHANARAMLKLIDELESRHAGKETPEAAADRKRREDAATRKAIEQHVIAYEAQAARDGVCLHCGAPRGAQGATTT